MGVEDHIDGLFDQALNEASAKGTRLAMSDSIEVDELKFKLKQANQVIADQRIAYMREVNQLKN